MSLSPRVVPSETGGLPRVERGLHPSGQERRQTDDGIMMWEPGRDPGRTRNEVCTQGR